MKEEDPGPTNIKGDNSKEIIMSAGPLGVG